MRLHTLEVTSFGPFADTVTVDFDQLGADGLFLLHGQTGAGKTTVLDSVAFALYGTVPGARKEGKRLLSDHAPAGSVPKVVLEATIGGRRLRISRSPEYERPKMRGTGVKTENAKANLEWLDGAGENLSRIPDIAREVERLLGMNADQFFQVVLLPQGEFAKFLRADNEDRGKLLEQLFDTTRFGTVEEWFLDRRRASAARVEDQRKQVDLLSARVSTAAGIEVGAEADPSVWARRLLEQAVETRELAAAELARMRVAEEHARAAAGEARWVRDLQVRRARAEAELAEHRSGAEERDIIATEADRARRAAPVAGVGADADAAARTAADASDRARALGERLATDEGGAALVAQLAWPPTDADRETIRTHVRNWTAEVARLDVLLAEAREAEQLDRELAGMRRRGAELAALADDLSSARAQWPPALQQAEEALRAAEQAAVALPALEDACARAADSAAAAGELHSARTSLGELLVSVAGARSRHQDARDRLLDLRERRIAGMAAELASGLVDGTPCAVCGSEIHPAPASAGESTVTKGDEDAARLAEQKAAGALESENERLSQLERVVAALIQRGGDGDREALVAAHAAAVGAVEQSRAAAATVPQRTQAVEKLRSRGVELDERSRVTEAERVELDTRMRAMAERLQQTRERLAAAAGDDGGVRIRRDRLEALAGGASELLDARDGAAAAVAAAREFASRADRAARDAGFDSVSHAVSGVRSAARLEQIELVLGAARDRLAGARAVLAEPDIVAVADLDPVDPAGLEAAAREAATAVEVAAAAVAEADTRRANLERLVSQLDDAFATLGPVLAAHDELAGLADVVAGRGQNARKMSLRSYVLASRLEEVAVSASTRLRRMSAGRYEFVHSDEAGPRGRRGGLGLDIRDDYTGVVRSAKTLSGGESFLASLSLALGLADVVAAESGGVVLDTMFIDEGFGTLDADTLDLVMGVLDELREGGRVVGIVSHVDEMRQRIPSRLHVVRGRAGSTVEMIAS
ncbi:SMC family ATPase [Rhodococcus sp. ABRD24]|uniref:AAA family ATPase n=1 Tax=Rhodococcus sp. ABRD24 TaxID=2507582 RepID=UPI00103B0F81|nr:SMC family ATPase [Rhodococcus sp. ABRD24]QBJ97685.1 SMC family ATPase [Rhodococcus sp. ABRD24]